MFASRAEFLFFKQAYKGLSSYSSGLTKCGHFAGKYSGDRPLHVHS